jgi:hypothetical protein
MSNRQGRTNRSWMVGAMTTSATLLLTAALTRAQSAGEQASVHFDRGLELVQEQQYPEAAVEFERAYDLTRVVAVLYNLGMAYAAAGRPVEAADALTRYLAGADKSSTAVERERVEAELQRQQARIGSVTFEVEPSGALVVVDGRELGVSPLRGPVRLSIGDHRVEVSRVEHEPVNRLLKVSAGQRSSLRIALRHVRAAAESLAMVPIRCRVPDAKVFVDDRLVAQLQSAALLSTTLGPHVIRFQRTGYVDTVMRVLVTAERTQPVDCSLHIVPQLSATLGGRIAVAAKGMRGTIRLDGDPLPADGRVPVGRHYLELPGRGYETWSQEFSLSPGETKRLGLEVVARQPVSTHGSAGQGDGRRTLAYCLAGAGLGLGLAAVAVYVANSSEFNIWSQENADLDVLADRASWQVTSMDVELEIARRRQANDRLLQSIWTLDIWSAGLAIGAAALVIAGTVVYVTGTDRQQPRAALGGFVTPHSAGIQWRGAL